jgi:DNA transformation protein and related proteins
MPVSPSYRAYVLEQLNAVGSVTAKGMFGGVGLYREGLFFGLIANDTLYFKVDRETRSEYERAGSEPFRPYGGQSFTMQYYELPGEVLEEPEKLRDWVHAALGAARRKVAGKRKRPPG